MRLNILKRTNAGPATTLLLALAVVASLLTASPVAAHAPQGAGDVEEFELEAVQIYDADGNLLEISIDDVAEIHGDLCMCVAGGYRAIQAAIFVLYEEDEVPTQGELTALYHHPGQGHKQAFESILTAECVTYEQIGSPQQMTLDYWSYEFTRNDTGETFELQLLDSIIPRDFFDYRYAVNGYTKGWHEDEPTEEERTLFAAAYTDSLNNLLTLPLWELYEGIEEPEEPTPVAAIVFSSALVVLVAVGFVYSARGKRR